MYQDIYYTDKSSGTFADALQAFGAAFVLREVLRCGVGSQAEVRLVDVGSAYALRLSAVLQEAWVEKCPPMAGAPFILTAKNRHKLPADIPEGTPQVVEYEVERDRRAEFLALFGGLSTEAKRARMVGGDHPELQALAGKGVHEHWDIFRALNPGALDAYNNVVSQWWEGRRRFADLLRVLLAMLATTPNDVDGAEAAWVRTCKEAGLDVPKKATAAQIFNPAQGKGQNRTKPDSVNPGNLKGFWLPEYLKAVGLYQSGLTRIVANPSDPRNARDRKTYVLAPREVALGEHDAIMGKFRRTMLGSSTAVKLDVLAALRYARAFLDHAEEAHVKTASEEYFGKRPGDLIFGLQMAFYKNLGNSAATMNIAMINLPAWVHAGPPEEMAPLKAVLGEHERIIRNLDERNSDAYELLHLYRDFVSANDLRPFFRFTTAYSGFYISQRERGHPCPAFTTTGLEVLLMNTDKRLLDIVQSEGFQNVAYAIRYSTVIPQARKARGESGYTVRYGLGQKLARKANYPQDFIAELSTFLLEYNAENEQYYERTRRRYRKGVRTTDIDEIVRLVDEFGSKVVCDLLVAYGYARSPYEAREDEGEQGVGDEGATEAQDADEEMGEGK